MVRVTGIMRSHPKDCDCQEKHEGHKKEERNKEVNYGKN